MLETGNLGIVVGFTAPETRSIGVVLKIPL